MAIDDGQAKLDKFDFLIKRYLEEHPEERDSFEVEKMVMQLYALKHGSVEEAKCK